MPHVGVVDAVLVRLLVQEVEHVLDGEGQGAAAVHRAEQRLKQVIHELLQRALMAAWPVRHLLIFFFNVILFRGLFASVRGGGKVKFSLGKAWFY